ncbi:MAG: DUF1207 domain-containing protein [Gammaproteobacteria bacterium]|jgi:hypothetical protein|nr:DUF1207 domain-containing protein [Gammaproteobacteria bacterium]
MNLFFIVMILFTGFVLTAAPRSVSAENDVESGMTALPATHLFEPLRADPKEPRFFVSTLKIDSALYDTTLGAVGFGENFGIVRSRTRAGVDWQLGIAGGVFAQFDLKAPSSDLVNADYIIGVPLTWSRENWSGRVRVYHQSSHLGDEFLLRTQPQRVNLSFEAIELIVAYDFDGIRFYGGGEYLFQHDPGDLDESLLHAGVDWRGRQVVVSMAEIGGAHWVAGLDVKRWQQSDWQVQVSVKAGLEFAPFNNNRQNARRWSVLAEFYDGPSPYGQFYPMDVRYWGVAIQLGL